ncbi:hypothetical protein V500_09423 [Pseudogymnoascus sp. VKM F-4518 (FW-2643)]|nr:hypothetical protein V500_09423 [Pseudogymnoascus sp. VKM F-4518 (FW-2643)]
MAGHRSRRNHTRKTPTDWGTWEYDAVGRRYVISRINDDGVEEFQYTDECEPAAPAEVLEEGVSGMNLSSDEPQPGEYEATTQGGRIFQPSSGNDASSLQLSTSPSNPSSPGSLSYSQGKGYSYMTPPSTAGGEGETYDSNVSGIGMSPSENTAPQDPTYATYVANYGRPQFGTALPQNSAGTYYSSANHAASNMLGNPATQDYGRNTQPTDFNSRGSPPTAPANNPFGNQGGRGKGSHAGSSISYVNHTTTNPSSQKQMQRPLWEGKLPTLYARLVVLTQIRLQSQPQRRVQVWIFLWTEPKGNGNGRGNRSDITWFTDTQYTGEVAYTSIRRFVIWKSHTGHSLCLKRGSNKPGIKPEHHAMIYIESKSRSPKHPPKGINGEKRLPNAPICVEAMGPGHSLDADSRLNYAKVYTVEHNLRVLFIGKIHKDSRKVFKAAYNKIHKEDDSPVVSMAEDRMNEDDEAGAEEVDDVHPSNRKYTY